MCAHVSTLWSAIYYRLYTCTQHFLSHKKLIYILVANRKKGVFFKVYTYFSTQETCKIKQYCRYIKMICIYFLLQEKLPLLQAGPGVTRFILYLPLPDVFPCAGFSGRFSAPDSCRNSPLGCAWNGLVCISQVLRPSGGALERCCASEADFCSQEFKGTFPNALQDLTSTGSRDFLGKETESAWIRHGRKWAVSDSCVTVKCRKYKQTFQEK